VGPTGDATLPMLLADSQATLAETGGALDTAIEQIALWVGQQLQDTQSSLTAVKAKLSKWANRALKTTGATLNDVVAVLQQNAAAYVDPQSVPSPSGVSTGLSPVAPSQQVRSNPAPSLLTDVSPEYLQQFCPPNQYTMIGETGPPSVPLPPGYSWVYNGVAANGMNEWVCRAAQPSLLSPVPPPTPVVPVSPTGSYYADGTPFLGDVQCLIAFASPDYPDSVPIYNQARALVGFYSAAYAEAGNCNGETPPTPSPPVTAPMPCELPPDVASWPGQRVVNLPYDLNQGGEASPFGECGQLMLKDAFGAKRPVQQYLDALATANWYAALFPHALGWTFGNVNREDG
jgi:hypothetical protein